MSERSGSSPSGRGNSAARWWFLLCLVLAVFVSGTALGLRALLADTSTSTATAPATSQAPGGHPSRQGPSPSPTATPGAPVLIRAGQGPLLPGIGSGQIYAQAATGIYRIELGTGLVTRTATPDLEEHATFLAGRGWVLVKSRWSPTGVFVRDGEPAAPLPREFDPEGFLHLGPAGRLWVQPESSTWPKVTTTVRLAELDGRPVTGRSVTVSRKAAQYTIDADGYGGLLMNSRNRLYRLDPARPGQAIQFRLISRGNLLAAGGRRALLWDCDRHDHCRLMLVDQRTRHRVSRPAAARTLQAKNGIGVDRNNYGDPALSPDGTHLAVTTQDQTGANRVHVTDLRNGRDTVLPGDGIHSNVNRQLAWSPNSRWLLALTDQQVRGYNTRTHTTTSVPLGSEPLLHLTTTNAPAW